MRITIIGKSYDGDVCIHAHAVMSEPGRDWHWGEAWRDKCAVLLPPEDYTVKKPFVFLVKKVE